MKKIIVFILVCCITALAGCAEEPPKNTGHDGWNNIVINDGKALELLVDLNQLMPTTNSEPTEQQPVVFRSVQNIADEFCEMFPNVSIKWAYNTKSVGDWAQWMTTQIATDDPPDIVCMHGAEYADRDWFIPLDDILEEPNVFIQNGDLGSERWKDLFPEYMWLSDMTSDATGRILGVPVTCYPGTATAYFYNKDIFEQLNLEIPANWEDFKEICQTITNAGYIAVAPWSLNAKANVDVWDIQFSLGPTYAEKIKDQWDYDNNGYMTQDELLRAVYEGVFYGQGQNRENILSLYGEIKHKYNNILQTGAADTNYEPLWNQGRVAMMEDGMWRLSAENVNAERKFEYGIFASPLADSNTSEYCADFEIGDGAYNPPIQESFNICKQAVEAKGEGHLLASKLFLMWLTTPTNIDRIVDEKAGECVGAIYGTAIPAEIEDYIRGSFARTPSCQWTTGVTVSTQTSMSRYFQYWIADRYNDGAFLKKYDEYLHNGAVDMITALNIDTTGWSDGYNLDHNYG